MAGITLIYQNVTNIEVVQIDYRYLGSTIHNNGEMKEDVANKIKTCWLKCLNASGVLYVKWMHVNQKKMFLKTARIPVILYGFHVGWLTFIKWA